MAGRDNVLFHGSVASGSAAGTIIPCSLLYGIENVRQGYGTPVLKHVRACYVGIANGAFSVPIEIKNSNWIDSAGLFAQLANNETMLNRDSLAFMRGRDKVLAPNTSWIVNAELPLQSSAAGDIYVLFEIEYSDVPGYSTENKSGSPVMKKCGNASVTAAANAVTPLGTFDNLLQNTTYLLSEVMFDAPGANASANFLILEGFSNQRGLTRILPCKNFGLADQIEGSVYLTKQTYNLSFVRSVATSGAAVNVGLEMIASNN